MFVPFDPPPPLSDLPTLFPTPFRPGTPHPLAARAALETQVYFESHGWVTPEMFRGPVGGKMIGVLVVGQDDGRIGYLRGFAGKLGGRWLVDGFVPPVFDVAEFERVWGPGSEKISELDREITALRKLGSGQSRGDDRLRELVGAQKELSRSLNAELHDTYRISNWRGQKTELRALFEPRLPPGGAGDCAAPKLLAEAYNTGARPIALAEFWWGGQPPAGGRQHGVYYPACRGKCGKLLPFMLEGLECEPAPDVGIKVVSDEAPAVVYEDGSIIVVDKPCGLLSVRGRGVRRQDSVERRIQQRAGLEDSSWPRLVHRLDLATSGLLIAAKNKEVYVAIQRQFSSRTVEKRYVAILRGLVPSDRGVIELRLGGDYNDRPRQMHDPLHGKVSVTNYNVLERDRSTAIGTTRVVFHPTTGRTHQLRLHAAHPEGLGTPIVGDLLYGFGGDRLMLHAEALTFVHPTTGETMELRSPCPF